MTTPAATRHFDLFSALLEVADACAKIKVSRRLGRTLPEDVDRAIARAATAAEVAVAIGHAVLNGPLYNEAQAEWHAQEGKR